MFLPKWDLGIRHYLIPQWKKMFSPVGLKSDITAGLTVACVAVPLSLAIALASHVPPATGLMTAIVAGFVVAIFGGTPLAVSGPAAAMAVLVASQVENQGMAGLLLIGAISGILQLLCGILGWGKIIRLVPQPVIVGFTAGIGAIILIGQLPRALGLPPPDQAHVLFVLQHLFEMFHKTDLTCVGLALLTLVICKGLPRWKPSLPAPLIAVVVPTLLAQVLKLNYAPIGAIPTSLPQPQIPSFEGIEWSGILEGALAIFCLGSLETLLSSTVMDRMSMENRHDPDQELVGQGLGNIAVAVLGGMPITGVIARSALNVRAGAKTRRSAIVHSLALLAMVFAFASAISTIPIAVLSGLLISVALGMLHPKELIDLWKASKPETMVGLLTFAVIVSVDLLVGIQAGIAAAYSSWSFAWAKLSS